MIPNRIYKIKTQESGLYPTPTSLKLERWLELGEHFMFLEEGYSSAREFLNLKILHKLGVSYLYVRKNPDIFEEVEL